MLALVEGMGGAVGEEGVQARVEEQHLEVGACGGVAQLIGIYSFS